MAKPNQPQQQFKKDNVMILSDMDVSPEEPCKVTEHPDGSMDVVLYVPPDQARRLKSRAHLVQLNQYLWDNIYRRAVENHVY
jgi:hypothetical protein